MRRSARGWEHGIGNLFADVQVWDRVGHNNLLAVADGKGGLVVGPFMAALRAAIDALRPTLVILDTLADVFGGNEVDRVQVNSFLKTCLGGLIRERRALGHDLTILLLGHPSKSAMADGSGFSGSTAWENGVRSRLYLSRPENSGPDERILSRAKANYAGGDDGELALIWSKGVFAVPGQLGGVERMALTVRNEVQSAWNAGVQYVEKKGPSAQPSRGPGAAAADDGFPSLGSWCRLACASGDRRRADLPDPDHEKARLEGQ